MTRDEGIPPDPVALSCGELVYPIRVNEEEYQALWDIGANASFMAAALVDALDLPTERLQQPHRLSIWDGPGAVITHSAFVRRVCFGGKIGSWRFYVDPSPPRPIVLGLDFCRKWNLTTIPATCHLVRLLPSDPRLLSSPLPTTWDATDPHSTAREDVRAYDLPPVVSDTRLVARTTHLDTPVEGWAVEATDSDTLTMDRHWHSVTAQSPEETQQREAYLRSLPES